MYSVSELSYLRTSLESDPPVRPDSRDSQQFRGVKCDPEILAGSCGSAGVTTADGSECIVGIKTKVVLDTKDLIEVSVNIAGFSDNDSLPLSVALAIHESLESCPELEMQLRLNPKYSFRLFVDCMVLSHSQDPLALVSLAVFEALKTTKLPKQVSNQDTSVLDEIPQFNDDWGLAVPVCASWVPPLLFIAAVVGNNVLVDPTEMEQHVADSVLCLTWKDNGIAAPVRTLDTSLGSFVGGVSPEAVLKAYDVLGCASRFVEGLA